MIDLILLMQDLLGIENVQEIYLSIYLSTLAVYSEELLNL